jgi:hypothetical protein
MNLALPSEAPEFTKLNPEKATFFRFGRTLIP